MNQQKLTVRDITHIALLAALIAVCSWISIPMTVPFTLQTMGVFTAVGLLGGKKGTVSVLVYILLGAVGLPVFSGFTGGIGILLGATGGFILGFLLCALLMWFMEALFGKKKAVLLLSMVLGLVACYAAGAGWLMLYLARASKAMSLASVISLYILPFVIPDLVKIAVAMLIIGRMERIIRK